MTEREKLIAAVAEYDRLLEVIEREPKSVFAEAALTRFVRKYPAVMDYDSKGNYIGEVSNENGWTP